MLCSPKFHFSGCVPFGPGWPRLNLSLPLDPGSGGRWGRNMVLEGFHPGASSPFRPPLVDQSKSHGWGPWKRKSTFCLKEEEQKFW